MKINNLSDLKGGNIIIYGAGSQGRAVYNILKNKVPDVGVAAFSDTFKRGVDESSGLRIIPAEEIKSYDGYVVVIGLSDQLKKTDVSEILDNLCKIGIDSERIITCSQFYELFADFDDDEFHWQKYSDDVYDFNTNKLLIESLSGCVTESDESVVDLGAGNMNLRKHIPKRVKYFPVDYKRRCDETVVCDFNKGEYPDIKADVYVLCAMLYYIDDPVALLKNCAEFAQKKIIVALNKKSLAGYAEVMKIHGFKNYMFFDEIQKLLGGYGFVPTKDITIESVARRYVMYEKQC